MKSIAIAAVALLGLAACGGTEAPASKEQQVVAVATANGTTTSVATTVDGTVTTRNSSQASLRSPSNFLPFAPPYPGAKIRTRVASADSAEGSGSMIAMETPDDFAKVVAFYDEKARAAGATATMVSNSDDGAVRIFGDSASNTGALISISPNQEAAGTVIVIASGEDPQALDAAKVAAAGAGRLQ